MIRKLLAAFIMFSVVLVPMLDAQGANVPDEQYAPVNEPGTGYFGFRSTPDFTMQFTNSYLLGMKTDGEKVVQIASCSSLTDANCAFADSWSANSIFGLCKTNSDTNCIEGLSAAKEDGTQLETTYSFNIAGNRPQDFDGDPSRDLPTGRGIPVFDIPGAPHEGGIQYIPIVKSGSDTFKSTNGKFTQGSPEFGIYAVKVLTESRTLREESTDASRYVTKYWHNGNGAPTGCIVNDQTKCAVPFGLPLSIKFGIRIRTTFAIPGWFHGRFSSPEIVTSKESNGNYLTYVAANPVLTPLIATWVKKTDLPANVIDYYGKLPKPLGGTGSGAGRLDLQNGDPNSWSLMRDTVSFNEQALEEFLLWLPVIGDRATATPTYWNIHSDSGDIQNSKCKIDSNSLSGIVSTNASQFLSGPPKWNQETQSLDYKVAAPHFQSNGEVFKGTYDLAIQSTYARCLYGFSTAPIKASISVVSENGATQVATTIVNEKSGWIYLSAKGFTFSGPKVVVKLEQDLLPIVGTVADSTKTSSPVISPKSTKKTTTISCVKGKTVKKVTSDNPKCPAGYKKK